MTGDTTLPLSTGPSSANTAESRMVRVQNAKRNRDSAVSLLTAVDSKNIIDSTGDADEQPPMRTGATSSAPPSTRLLRTRTAKQSKLAYDLKYHPMDDSLRPTQAAKRRSAHGEELLYSDATDDASSVLADTDAESAASIEDDAEDDRKHARSTMRNRKRSRAQSQSPQPTRRSSRRTEDRKMSYRMDIHPQDEQLEVSSDVSENHEVEVSNNAEDESSAARPKRAKLHTTLPNMVIAASHDERNTHTLEQHTCVAVSSGPSVIMADREAHPIFCKDHLEKDMESSPEEESDIPIGTPSPSSLIATPPPHGVRRKEGLDVWKLTPGERYFPHDRNAWPSASGLSFEIYSDRLEDQLAAEAKAASPLEFEHDDKENDFTADADPETSTTASATVMPASHYRRTSGENEALQNTLLVGHALYDGFDTYPSPYGLGGDGTLECMRLLASEEQLPRAPDYLRAQAGDIDCVIT